MRRLICAFAALALVIVAAPASSQGLFGTGSQVQWGPMTEAVYVSGGGGVALRDGNLTVGRIQQVIGGQRSEISTVEQRDTGGFGEIGIRLNNIGPVMGLDRVEAKYSYFGVAGSTAGGGSVGTIAFPSPTGLLDLFCPALAGYGINYLYNFARHSWQGTFSGMRPYGNILVGPRFGARFSHTSRSDEYVTNVPAVATQGITTTDTFVNSFGAVAGLDVVVPFGFFGERQAVSTFEIFAHMLAGLDYNSASSKVVTQVTSPGFQSREQITVSDNKFTTSIYIEAGLRTRMGNWQAGLSGIFEYGRYAPDVNIPGNGAPAFLIGEREMVYGAKAELRFAFGGQPVTGPKLFDLSDTPRFRF